MTAKVRHSEMDSNNSLWVVDNDHADYYIQPDGSEGPYFVYDTEAEAQAALDLYLEKQPQQCQVTPGVVETMREFKGGATRDTLRGKLSYVKALSPIVLQRYVQYLNVHRLQPDGSMRDFDNWKKGIPKDVYFDGLGRHFLAAWLLAQDFPAEDNHGPVTLEDSLAAVIFNASGWLHELVKERINYQAAIDHEMGTETKPSYGGKIDRTKLTPGGY